MIDWKSAIDSQPEPVWFSRRLDIPTKLLARAKSGADVSYVQTALAAPLTGTYDEATEQRVKGLQQAMGLPVNGIVDARTARAIDYIAGVEASG